ncbi:Nucleic-acid-binding protein from transposon X-element [Eumeta japonica]|uniref:Nucleic-acid-binding protein from transposon X-element n=1 Tax=Eumeta variegata TaxID=151549 RepID=A0A4C1UIP6_EUMVA|nr:Nucleic-acid-binding protein from transposon X-element [Eumeta japonica]
MPLEDRWGPEGSRDPRISEKHSIKITRRYGLRVPGRRFGKVCAHDNASLEPCLEPSYLPCFESELEQYRRRHGRVRSEFGKSSSKYDTSFTLVKGKNKKEVKKALKKSKLERSSPVRDMEVEVSRKATIPTPATKVADPPTPGSVTTSTRVATDRVANVGAKPSAPTKGKALPPIYLLEGANFVRISADCTRLRINYTMAVRVADDGIKITCPDVEIFRSLNKYLIDSEVKLHTYALEEKRKLKAVIRGVPVDFDINDIKTDLINQGFPVQSVHRLCRRDGSPLWLVMVILPRTEKARQVFGKLSKVCGLSGIRVEALLNRGGRGQCHRCQRYGS